ncbi:MAG TPA: M55 family metallopeptidase [Acidimicrobiales bacterium]|jgi:D-amino peptidase|nr:M55 family metallopeptidase [Acidimicrobiales bacterium]
MKIFISSDMEGTAGVVDWDHVMASGPLYPYYCELLTNEINAAIEGAMRAGADEFLVNDSHSKMANLKPSELAGSARYLSGRVKPMYMMQGLDETFDAVFFISYHGSMSSQGSTLSHTYFPTAFAQISINGVIAGEAAINTLVAKAYGVPLLLITGDEVTAREIAPFAPSARAVVVKNSVSRFAADSMHPTEACELINEQAFQAVSSLATAKQIDISTPTTMEIEFRTSDYADLASRVAGVKREDTLRCSITLESPLELYRTFITVVLLCRGLTE